VVVFYVSRRLFDGAGVCLRQVKDSCWHLSDGYSVLSSLPRCLFSFFITECPVILRKETEVRVEVGHVIRGTEEGCANLWLESVWWFQLLRYPPLFLQILWTPQPFKQKTNRQGWRN